MARIEEKMENLGRYYGVDIEFCIWGEWRD